MGQRHPETPADRSAWARLWAIARRPWSKTEPLAKFLGVGRTTLVEWCPEGRNEGAGEWALLRKALKETARSHPLQVAEMIEALAEELLDADGRWVPKGTAPEDLDWSEESDDVDIARGKLAEAMRSAIAPPTVIEAAADRFEREAHEAAQAARQAAAKRRAVAA